MSEPFSPDFEPPHDANPPAEKKSLPERIMEWWQNRRGRKSRGSGKKRGSEPERQQTPPPADPPQWPEPPPKPEQSPFSPAVDPEYSRESDSLAEIGNDEFRILPGDHWGLHYPRGADARSTAITGLLGGAADPSAEVASVTPDALTYRQDDIRTRGVDPVRQRIRDIVTTHNNYEYERLTSFLSYMQGSGIDPDEALQVYDNLISGRVRHQMLEEYDHQDRARVTQAFREEAHELSQGSAGSGMEHILEVARTRWLQDHQIVNSIQQQMIEQHLSDADRGAYMDLRDAYRQFAESGDNAAWQSLIRRVREYYVNDEGEQGEDEEQQSEEGQQGDEQGTPQEPPPQNDDDEFNDAPEATDTYNPTSEDEHQTKPDFIITPEGSSTEPKTGYYARRIDDKFDQAAKTWSTPTTTVPYSDSPDGTARQKIRGKIHTYNRELPIPYGFAPDMATLQVGSGNPRVLRDQNGCFIIVSDQDSTFSVEFLKEQPPFIVQPIPADRERMHRGSFSAETEAFLASLTGSDVEKAGKIGKYVREHHEYPDDPGAVQDGLKNSSTPDNYFQNLEAASHLECYSANTLAIAMMREVGIASRLVQGEKQSKKQNGQVLLDNSTHHGWSEYWNGSRWVLLDATPAKAAEDGEEGDSDEPGDPGEPGEGEPGEGEPGEGEPGEGGEPGDGSSSSEGGQGQPGSMPSGEASDGDVQQGQQDLDAMKEYIDQAERRKEELNQQLDQIDNFKDLADLKDQLEDDPIFEDMKEEIERRAEALEEQRKTELERELAEMERDGFISAEDRERLQEELQSKPLEELDDVVSQMREEGKLYDQFKRVQEYVMPTVNQTMERLRQILPKFPELDIDEDSLADEGDLDTDALGDPSRRIWGDYFHPAYERQEIRPYYNADIVVDVSKSMDNVVAGRPDQTKIFAATALVVGFLEIMDKLEKEFGYIHSSVSAFAEGIDVIKTVDMDYGSTEKYDFENANRSRERSTVKARIFKAMQTKYYTNMYEAVQHSAHNLDEVSRRFPEYASSMYFVGDGEDTGGGYGGSRNPEIRRFMETSRDRGGFGKHMRHAIMLGDESQRRVLADVFGDDHTAVASDLEGLFRTWTHQFERDVRHVYPDNV